MMHLELVERRRWISGRRFLHALNYCMLLPGPEAQQLATYVGWLTDARDVRRGGGGRAVGAAAVADSDCAHLGICILRQPACCGRDSVRHQTRSHRHCRVRSLPHRHARSGIACCGRLRQPPLSPFSRSIFPSLTPCRAQRASAWRAANSCRTNSGR